MDSNYFWEKTMHLTKVFFYTFLFLTKPRFGCLIWSRQLCQAAWGLESECLLLRNLRVLKSLGSNRMVFPVEISALRYFVTISKMTVHGW